MKIYECLTTEAAVPFQSSQPLLHPKITRESTYIIYVYVSMGYVCVICADIFKVNEESVSEKKKIEEKWKKQQHLKSKLQNLSVCVYIFAIHWIAMALM